MSTFWKKKIEAVAEEEAHALEVDGRARHQLAGLVAVVEAERQPDEVRVHAAAHVHLDVERLLAGEEAAARHQRGAHDTDAGDQADDDPEPVRVMADERLVDDPAPRQPDERDLCGLRADGEEDRDEEADAVGAKEAEQAYERRSVRNGTHFRQGIGVVTAPDGSPVELYALFPDRGEGEIVAGAVPAGASILELGCGTGRMTRQLVARGFAVAAVDESPEMLEHVRGAETVCARIEGLDLGRRFDAVLLASNLFSTEVEQRRAFLATCARHSDVVVVETLPLGWEPKSGSRRIGAATSETLVDRIEDGVVHGAVEYAARGKRWRHEFSMRVFADEQELAAALAEGGFRLDRWLDRERGWFVAQAAPSRTSSASRDPGRSA